MEPRYLPASVRRCALLGALAIATTLALPASVLAAYHGATGNQSATPAQSRSPKDVVVVDMSDDLKFLPREIRIKAGQTVEWHNVEVFGHTVTADPARVFDKSKVALPDGAEPFHSGSILRGESYRRTFITPGSYRYVCLPHETADMAGTVIVE